MKKVLHLMLFFIAVYAFWLSGNFFFAEAVSAYASNASPEEVARANDIRQGQYFILNNLTQMCKFDVNLIDGSTANMFPITKYIVCATNIMVTLVREFIESFGSILSGMVAAALVLYIIIYGLKVAMMDQQLNSFRGFFVHIISAAVVAYFIYDDGDYSFANIYEFLLSSQLELISWFVDATANELDCEEVVISNVQANYTLTATLVDVFYRLDCSLVKLVSYGGGGAIGNNRPFAAIFLLFLLLIFKFFGIAVTIFVLVVTAILTFLKLILRILMSYLYAMMALGITIILAPLFVPAWLFSGTKSIFDSWIRNVLAYVLQPVFIFAFMSVFLIAIAGPLILLNEAVALLVVDENIEPDRCLNLGSMANAMGNVIGFPECNHLKDGFGEVLKDIIILLLTLIVIFFMFLSMANWIDQISHELTGGGLMMNVLVQGSRLGGATVKTVRARTSRIYQKSGAKAAVGKTRGAAQRAYAAARKR